MDTLKLIKVEWNAKAAVRTPQGCPLKYPKMVERVCRGRCLPKYLKMAEHGGKWCLGLQDTVPKLLCLRGLCARCSDRTKKDACATTAAMPTPPAPPVKDCKSVGAVGGEPEDGPWSPNPFDPGGDPKRITKELALPHAMHSISWSSVTASGWSWESPFQ